MSFAGIREFKENLDILMSSDAFKKASPGEQIEMGDRLLRSKFGIGSIFGCGETKPLNTKE